MNIIYFFAMYNPTLILFLTPLSDRNWLEFLSVIDGTFASLPESKGEAHAGPSEDAKEQCSSKISNTLALFTNISVQDGRKDRSGLLGLLELEHRARRHGVSTGRSQCSPI